MYRGPPIQNAAPQYPSFSFSSATTTTNISSVGYGTSNNNSESTGRRSTSRPRTSSADPHSRPSLDYAENPVPQQRPHVLTKERRLLSRRPSFSRHRRSRSTSSAADQDNGAAFVTDDAVPPALPHYALSPNLGGQAGFQPGPGLGKKPQHLQPAASVVVSPPPGSTDSFSRMLSRTAPSPGTSYAPSAVMFGGQLAPPPAMIGGGGGAPSEGSYVYQLIHDTANKRISTLDYLRKAHEGRVYWFNTLLFDKPDLQRMPYFDPRKLARRATNYLLLGLSLPAVVDLNSSSAMELLKGLSALLSEFESFQQLHSESGGASSSLSRARLPHMFRRAPGGKGRRTSGAGEMGGYSVEDDGGSSGPVGGAGSGGAFSPSGGGSVMNFAASETDLLPGEEYTHLLTPSLPFDPDFFETFATLCDVLIDCYARLLALMPTPKDCTSAAAELFTKVDGKIRKLIVQNVVKEFEDTSRSGLKTEVANVGKVVLGGLL